MRVLLIGDIVGKGGRQAVNALVPGLLQEYKCDFCVANGENMAGGNGFTKACIRELDDSGVDVFTGGDHMWDQREFASEIDGLPNVLRPANLPECQPGKGWGIFYARNGEKIAVMSLLGRTFMPAGADCPFATAEKLLPEIKAQTPIVVIDFHAEATSEKIALGRYFAGQVSAVVGTHTHVPTADQQIFPPGTAFQCDLGMVGARESVLGRDLQPVLHRFRTGMPARFTVNDRGIRLQGAVVTIAADGKAQSIERVMRDMR